MAHNRIGRVEIASIYIGGSTSTNLINKPGGVLTGLEKGSTFPAISAWRATREIPTGKRLTSRLNRGSTWLT